MNAQKLEESLADLRLALEAYAAAGKKQVQARRLAYLSFSKAFESAVGYAWKHLKRTVTAEGLDPQSPKAAVRDAARLGLIADPQPWIEFIDARNAGVHDYFSLTEDEYEAIARKFLQSASQIAGRKSA